LENANGGYLCASGWVGDLDIVEPLSNCSLVGRLPGGFGLFAFAEVVMDAAEQERQPSRGDQQLTVLSRPTSKTSSPWTATTVPLASPMRA
jgi:hypothetical protein